MIPKRGFIFVHAFWLDKNNKPLRMRVTNVSRGSIYYRALDGSFPMHCPVEHFSRYVKTEKEQVTK